MEMWNNLFNEMTQVQKCKCTLSYKDFLKTQLERMIIIRCGESVICLYVFGQFLTEHNGNDEFFVFWNSSTVTVHSSLLHIL